MLQRKGGNVGKEKNIRKVKSSTTKWTRVTHHQKQEAKKQKSLDKK